ncbi:NADH dehydrogenase [ubiquinone] 1 alpha subcomplex assembly factor 3 [Leptopilina boulardi]|uniref:NADH dehydrogenase [ubiquinone] 1 alpha subcomplex assembly factor 3 n=1 Tax=Leptopilina boulardi TaxID=63433 RepID=UPI0021F5382C|nr:NADH dehydrogenase [ubiquinone] 1 alpha subcomplex assembly factor 3 [Leptopilina boulardi]
MTSSIRKIFQFNSTIKRCFNSSTIRKCELFDQGKTTMKFMNKDTENGFIINAFSEVGFTVSPSFNIIGPMIIFPRMFLSWNIATSSDMNEENLCLFNIIEPKLDVLIIGLDKDYPAYAPFLNDIRSWLKKSNINGEILPIKHAISTYNFLTAEGRFIAAALIPPKTVFIPKVGYKPLPDHERLPAF